VQDFIGAKIYCLHAHADGTFKLGEDAGVPLKDVIYTVSVPYYFYKQKNRNAKPA